MPATTPPQGADPGQPAAEGPAQIAANRKADLKIAALRGYTCGMGKIAMDSDAIADAIIAEFPALSAPAQGPAAGAMNCREEDGGFIIEIDGRPIFTCSRGSHALDMAQGLTLPRAKSALFALGALLLRVDERKAHPVPAAPAAPVEPQRIDQTITGAKGNCFSACLAMLLGLPISEVPNFCDAPGFDEDPGPAFMKAAHEWLNARGWGHITVAAAGKFFERNLSKGYVMAAGMTSRGFLHSVVYKDGELWHDPHPSHEGIQEVLEVDLIFPLNPAGLAAHPGSASTGPFEEAPRESREATEIYGRPLGNGESISIHGIRPTPPKEPLK